MSSCVKKAHDVSHLDKMNLRFQTSYKTYMQKIHLIYCRFLKIPIDSCGSVDLEQMESPWTSDGGVGGGRAFFSILEQNLNKTDSIWKI